MIDDWIKRISKLFKIQEKTGESTVNLPLTQSDIIELIVMLEALKTMKEDRENEQRESERSQNDNS